MDASPNNEEKERIIEEMKKKRRNIHSGTLILPMTCAILMTCLGIWMIATMDMIESCELQTGSTDTEMHMILPRNFSKWDTCCCIKLNLADRHPYLFLDFLPQLVVGGGIFKGASTARLFRQAQSSLEAEHLLEWGALAIPIWWITSLYSAHYVNQDVQVEFPKNGINDEQGIYNLCDILRIILYFSVSELIITIVSLIVMYFFRYNDAIIESEYNDRFNARARRQN